MFFRMFTTVQKISKLARWSEYLPLGTSFSSQAILLKAKNLLGKGDPQTPLYACQRGVMCPMVVGDLAV